MGFIVFCIKRCRMRASVFVEKYGTLRYYCDATDEMEELIAATEIESSKTCEICGALGEICVKNYWYKTLCNTCATTNGYAPDPELDTP